MSCRTFGHSNKWLFGNMTFVWISAICCSEIWCSETWHSEKNVALSRLLLGSWVVTMNESYKRNYKWELHWIGSWPLRLKFLDAFLKRINWAHENQGCQMVYFRTKDPNLGKCLRALKLETVDISYGHFEYFTDIWDILCPFCTVCVHLVHFLRFWYHAPKKSGNHDEKNELFSN
jgi:hypothetical protein